MSIARQHLMILGGGPAGYVGALRAARLGFEVTLVERKELGGTCLNWGCIPSKSILHTARIAVEARQLFPETASQAGKSQGEWNAMRERKIHAVQNLKAGVASLLRGAHVEVVQGEGRVVSPREIVVGQGKDRRTIRGDALLVATGSEPLVPGLFASEDPRVVTSTEALELKEKPTSVMVVGAGAVGVEFARFYAAFGVSVTIVEMMDQCIPGSDSEMARALQKSLERAGIEILLGSKVVKLESVKRGIQVQLEDGKSLKAGQVLVAIGRKLNLEGIGLDEIGVERDESGRFLKTSKQMQTSVQGVFAAGDITGGYLLAHKASAEALTAVSSLAGKGQPVRYDRIPACIYGEPEMASVGATEEALKSQGVQYGVGKFHYSHLGRAWAEGKTEGFFKVLADSITGEIFGVHILGESATEMIHEACVALRLEATVEELMAVIHSHPSFSEGLWEATASTIHMGIH